MSYSMQKKWENKRSALQKVAAQPKPRTPQWAVFAEVGALKATLRPLSPEHGWWASGGGRTQRWAVVISKRTKAPGGIWAARSRSAASSTAMTG